MGDNYSPLAREELRYTRLDQEKRDHKQLADFLTRLHKSQEGNTEYLRALADVADLAGITRTETVTYA